MSIPHSYSDLLYKHKELPSLENHSQIQEVDISDTPALHQLQCNDFWILDQDKYLSEYNRHACLLLSLGLFLV